MTNTATPAGPSSSSIYSDPKKDCDLVMKGGLTSGIVYPATVLKLAKNTIIQRNTMK